MSQVDARLYEQCLLVYTTMRERSAERIADGGHTANVYVGFTTYLFEDIGLSISNYTPVMRRLQSMGCIEQLARGGRGMPSEWLLLKEPTEHDFSRSTQRWRKDRERIRVLEQRLDELEALVQQHTDTQKAS
jgi:hypothetical protein